MDKAPADTRYLVLSLMGHAMPRRLSIDKQFGADAIGPLSRSIVAGCTSATSITRIQVNGVLNDTDQALDRSNQQLDNHIWNQHVDDVSHTACHTSEDVLVEGSIAAGLEFIQQASRRRLVISGKSLIVISPIFLSVPFPTA